MDFMLRCNSLPCRTELNDRAVVTTCSHIFCISCSQNLGLSTSTGDRICPACESSLPNPDDAVSTILNPTEDYKTSVLSGLSPNIIMECASRGLSFWSYQSTQEIIYQEYLARNLREKYSSLKSDMEKFTRDANSEIGELQNKLSSMQLTHNELQKKNHELAEALREKTKKHSQMQELYNKLKRRMLYSRVQSAASDALDHSMQGNIGIGDGLPDNLSVLQNEHRSRAPPSPQRHHVNPPTPMGNHPIFGTHRREGLNDGTIGLDGTTRPPFPRVEAGWTGIGGQLPQHGPIMTPAQHRQPLPAPVPRAGHSGSVFPSHAQPAGYRHSPSRSSNRRQTLGGLNANTSNNAALTGYGMSAGMKISR